MSNDLYKQKGSQPYTGATGLPILYFDKIWTHCLKLLAELILVSTTARDFYIDTSSRI